MVEIELLGGEYDGDRIKVEGRPPVVHMASMILSPATFTEDLKATDEVEVMTKSLTYNRVGKKHLNGRTFYQLDD